MFHKRCNEEITFLRKQLEASEHKNEKLQEQVLILSEKPVVPVSSNTPANVYYMDDVRLLEMEDTGDVPT